MNKFQARKWGRFLVQGGLLLLIASLLAGTTQAEESMLDQLVRTGKVILPSQVKPGMRGVGRSVFHGTKIENFNVEILGVLGKINSGGDIVLIKILNGPVVERKTGIIAGMSGSPIYVDGKLLGAIAFGWSFAREPIGGVTPFGDMLRSISDSGSGDAKPGLKEAALPSPLVLNGTTFSRASIVPRRQEYSGLFDVGNPLVSGQFSGTGLSSGTICLEPVYNPLLVSGFGMSSLSRLSRIFAPYHLTPVVGPGSTSTPVDAELEPGAAVCAQLVRGDLDISAVGTVTYRDGDQILAFGHPFLGVGDLNVPMANAFVHDIFPSQEMSFKFASPGQSKGAITQDWAWAIGGKLGKEAPMVPVTINVSDPERKASRTFQVEVTTQKDLLPQLILDSAIEATYATYGMQTEDTVKVGLRVEAEGLPAVQRENLYYDDGYAVIAAVTELADALSVLTQNDFERAKIKKVELNCQIERNRRSARIKRIFTNRSKIKPGEEIEVGVAIEPHGKPVIIKTTTFTIPKDTPGGLMWIGVGSGMSELMLRSRLGLHIPFPTNLTELLALYEQLRSNSDLVVKAALPRYGVSVSGKDMSVLPATVFQVMRSSRSTDVRPIREQLSQVVPTDWMITGTQLLSVQIDSKKKAPMISGPTPRSPGSEESGDQSPPGNESPPPGPNETTTLRVKNIDDLAILPRSPLLKLLETLETWQPALPEVKEQKKPKNKTGPADGGGPKAGETNEANENKAGEDEDSGPATPSPPTPPGSPEGGKPIGRLPQIWRQSSVQDFLAGTMTNVAVTTRGDIRLAPESRLLLRSDELYFWSVTADDSGNAYLGTGNEGKIYKVTPEGKSEMVFDSPEVAITQVLSVPGADKGGVIYAAGAPDGVIYRIDEKGQISTFVDLPVPFIWCMAMDSKGDMYAGTGPHGQIYRIKPDGKYEVVTTLPQDHVRTLALGKDNTLYAGTGDTGVIYRIKFVSSSNPAINEMEALYNSNNGEITSLALDVGGNLYFGTAGKAGVYRIDPSGTLKTLYEPQLQAVYRLVIEEGNLYAATGDTQRQGIVYRITLSGDESINRILEAEQTQILGLCVGPKGRLLACTGNGAALYELKLPFNQTGTFESDVFDAKDIARCGNIRWKATAPEGTSVYFETRTGNTKLPDESWSEWSGGYAESSGSPVASPTGRFLQYRCQLNGTASVSPILEQVEMVYSIRNQAPSLVLKNPKGGEWWSGNQTIDWTGKDPDNDTLTYEVYLSDDNGTTWKPQELKDRKSAAFSLDTRALKNGTYRAKVVTKDDLANPGEGRGVMVISKPFGIDNGPPLLLFPSDTFKEGSNNRFFGKALAIDDLSNIASAEFRVDGGDWRVATASDKIFDSPWEEISLETASLEPGSHSIELRVRDAAGNVVSKKTELPDIPKPSTSPTQEKK